MNGGLWGQYTEEGPGSQTGCYQAPTGHDRYGIWDLVPPHLATWTLMVLPPVREVGKDEGVLETRT